MNYTAFADAILAVVESLRSKGVFVDEEGEHTNTLEDAAAILRRLDAAQGGVDGVMSQVKGYGVLCTLWREDLAKVDLAKIHTAVESLALGGWQPVTEEFVSELRDAFEAGASNSDLMQLIQDFSALPPAPKGPT